MTTAAMHRLDEPVNSDAAPRRGGRFVVGFALVLIFTSVAWWLIDAVADEPFFPLRRVTLDGQLRHVTEAELRRAMAPHLHGGLLALDVDAIRGAVESLPWVAAASVRRLWPHTLAIEIEERQPVARWGEDALVDTEAVVFQPAALPEGLPRLSGPEARREQVLQLYRTAVGSLRQYGMDIERLKLDARGAWTLVVTDGVVIELGNHELDARLERFLGALPRLRSRSARALERVDLRYPNGFAVEWEAVEGGQGNRNRKTE